MTKKKKDHQIDYRLEEIFQHQTVLSAMPELVTIK
jgi:hypothetical protein